MYLRNPELRTGGSNPILTLGDSIDLLSPARIKAPICFGFYSCHGLPHLEQPLLITKTSGFLWKPLEPGSDAVFARLTDTLFGKRVTEIELAPQNGQSHISYSFITS